MGDEWADGRRSCSVGSCTGRGAGSYVIDKLRVYKPPGQLHPQVLDEVSHLPQSTTSGFGLQTFPIRPIPDIFFQPFTGLGGSDLKPLPTLSSSLTKLTSQRVQLPSPTPHHMDSGDTEKVHGNPFNSFNYMPDACNNTWEDVPHGKGCGTSLDQPGPGSPLVVPSQIQHSLSDFQHEVEALNTRQQALEDSVQEICTFMKGMEATQ
ncbi:hypothetical protein JB92DRAFT_2836458 [Gautieria morchelliformis]|nr:hypothetical protein JB92DRAFT_2836458 [Gautieria morchelliformis]